MIDVHMRSQIYMVDGLVKAMIPQIYAQETVANSCVDACFGRD